MSSESGLSLPRGDCPHGAGARPRARAPQKAGDSMQRARRPVPIDTYTALRTSDHATAELPQDSSGFGDEENLLEAGIRHL